MFDIKLCRDKLSLMMSSSYRNIGRAVLEFEDYLKKYHLKEKSISKAMVVLRELLDNAVKHGNMGDSQDKVIVKIGFFGSDLFRIEVKDNGCGFDYNILDTSIPSNPKIKGRRGYILIAEYADRIDFNKQGNRITVHLTLTRESKHHNALPELALPTRAKGHQPDLEYHPILTRNNYKLHRM